MTSSALLYAPDGNKFWTLSEAISRAKSPDEADSVDKGEPMILSVCPFIAYVGTMVAPLVFWRKKASCGRISATILKSWCSGGLCSRAPTTVTSCGCLCVCVGTGSMQTPWFPSIWMREKMSDDDMLMRCPFPVSAPFWFIQEATTACDNVEIRYCAPQKGKKKLARHRRGSLQSPSPESNEVEIGACMDSMSPAKAFVKINNKESNDWKVWFKGRASEHPVAKFEVDVVAESKKITGFAIGVAPLSVLENKATSERPLRSVAGHGGCASAIFSRHGWVHGKCCAGEIGHVGTAVVQPPGQNYMDLGVFPSLSECLEARCPVGPLEELPKCRCRFPSHVCPARGSNACIEAPVYQLNTGVSCNPSGTYHLSVEACHALCNLDNDCTGFEVEAQSLKKCRLFTKWSRCTAPVYGMLARGHTYTKPQKHEERPPSETAWISVGIVTVLFVPIVTLLVVVFWLPV